MLSLPKRGRRAAAVVGGAALVGSLALATPAFAGSNTAPTAKNNMVLGSGSATTYQVMTALGDLYNGLPGCNMVVASGDPQPLNYSCQNPPNPKTAPYAENPLNDVAVEEPPLGSSSGIAQLEDQANPSPPVPVAPANFARSSRAVKSPGDDAGLNFVAYAKDGVSWFHFKEVDGVKTASYAVASLTPQQIGFIASGTYTNWDQVGGANAPISVFAAQAGSGTESTWESGPGTTNWPVQAVKDSNAGTTDHVILENEDRQMILATNETPSAGLKYIGNVIFLFSYGKYTVSCSTGPKVCGGSPVPGTTAQKLTTAVLGEINGIAPTVTTILNGTFPVPRFIYNVYANSHSGADNPKLSPATPATLNFVSEAGFMCKANTAVLDPVTGIAVRTEITRTISSNGFIPLPLATEDQGINYPATFAAGSPYKQFDNSPGGKGYCVVSTTG